MNILSVIANDPNVSPAFRAAIEPEPTKRQVAAWYTLQAAIAARERTDDLKREKQDQDYRERVLGDAWVGEGT